MQYNTHLRLAEEAEALALATTDPQMRRIFEDLAARWRTLAELRQDADRLKTAARPAVDRAA